MKHNVLFVDDEALVLQGLQRMLHPLRAEWNMKFVESGAAALKYLETHAVHVVVSDMRMPGMNGAELLGRVMRLYPQSIRLVLSGHADHDLILKCVGSTHQYLSKPCDPDSLRKTVARALALDAALKNERIQKLMARMEYLPSIPTLYAEIVELMHDPEVVLEAVGAVIARDLGMTAQILKLINSAFFGLRREISSPTEAVSYLGMDTIKSLVLSIHAFSEFAPIDSEGFCPAALWHHSLAVAADARALAKFETQDRKLMDEAFAGGLLHDAGKAALAFNFSTEYSQLSRACEHDHLDLLTEEQKAFGVNHADVGGYLLGLWGLPTPVVEAIALHHDPLRSVNAGFSPLTAVHVANALRKGPSDPAACGGLDLEYLGRLARADRIAAWQELMTSPNEQENYDKQSALR